MLSCGSTAAKAVSKRGHTPTKAAVERAPTRVRRSIGRRLFRACEVMGFLPVVATLLLVVGAELIGFSAASGRGWAGGETRFRNGRERPTIREPFREIVDDQICHGTARLLGCRADMGKQGGVRSIEQRLRHIRLVSEDVEAGSGDRALRQSLDESRLVNRAAAADIDENAVRPERSQDIGADDLLGGRT